MALFRAQIHRIPRKKFICRQIRLKKIFRTQIVKMYLKNVPPFPPANRIYLSGYSGVPKRTTVLCPNNSITMWYTKDMYSTYYCTLQVPINHSSSDLHIREVLLGIGIGGNLGIVTFLFSPEKSLRFRY
jgi:hypothetical protein